MTQHFTATYRGGQLVPDEPVDLLEGQKFIVALTAEAQSAGVHDPQTDETVWDEPAAIEARLARFDAIEPIPMSDAEMAEWEAARAEMRRVTLEAVRKEMGLP